MNRQCLICDSSAVLTREAAKGLTLLIGLFNGAIEGAQHPHEISGQSALLSGLTAVVPTYPEARKEADGVVRFHFATLTLYAYAVALYSTRRPKSRSDLTPAEARHQTLHKLQHQRTVT